MGGGSGSDGIAKTIKVFPVERNKSYLPKTHLAAALCSGLLGATVGVKRASASSLMDFQLYDC